MQSETQADTPAMRPNHLALISIPVKDQQAAKTFYSETMGFTVTADTSMPGAPGEGRWIELAPEGAQTRITLVTWFEAMPPGSVQGLVLDVPDIRAAYAALQARGVTTSEIESAPRGSFITKKEMQNQPV